MADIGANLAAGGIGFGVISLPSKAWPMESWAQRRRPSAASRGAGSGPILSMPSWKKGKRRREREQEEGDSEWRKRQERSCGDWTEGSGSPRLLRIPSRPGKHIGTNIGQATDRPLPIGLAFGSRARDHAPRRPLAPNWSRLRRTRERSLEIQSSYSGEGSRACAACPDIQRAGRASGRARTGAGKPSGALARRGAPPNAVRATCFDSY